VTTANARDPAWAGGAVGNGIANDTAALTAAVNALSAGGELFLDEGNYPLDTGIVLPRVAQKSIKIRGAGQGATQITFTGAGHAFTFGGTSNADAAYGQWIEDMTIQCTYAGNAILGAAKFRAATWCGLRRVTVRGANLGSQILVDLDEGSSTCFCFYNTVEKCDLRGVDQPTDIGVRLRSIDADGANANWVKGNLFSTFKQGVLVASGDENWIGENHFNGFITTGVRLDSSGTGNANNNYVAMNQFDGPTTAVDTAAGSVETYVVLNLGSTAYINGGTNIRALGNYNAAWTGAGTFKLDADGGINLPTYTVATRPSAAARTGQVIFVSDGGAGAVFQGSNGAAWVNLG
jgi:hypothetical protein